MKLPEGWKLVPVEACDEMITAACEVSDLFRIDFMRAYDAALEAAPTPPERDDEPVAYVPIHPTMGPLFGATNKKKGVAEGLNNLPVLALYTRPAPLSELRKVALLAHRELCILGGSHNKAAMALLAVLNKAKE